MRVNADDILAGRYRVLHRIGRADDDTFWLAEDERAETPGYRVNVRLPHDPDVSDMHEALLREARIMSSVRLPSVVRVLAVTEDHGVPLLITEDVTGEPLPEVERGPALQAARAVTHALQLIEGLSAMSNIAGHGSTVVHRSAVVLDKKQLVITGISVDEWPDGRPDPAVREIGLALRGMLGHALGSDTVDQFISTEVAGPALRATVDRATTGRITTLEELRRRLRYAMDERAQKRRRLQWIGVGALAAVAVLFMLVGLVTCGGGSPTRGGGGGGPVTALRAADVPNVIGMDRGAAQDSLERAGFSVVVLQRPHGGTPKGQVFAQVPAADSRTAQGSRVVVKVSTGPVPVEVPDVRWVPLSTARAMLHRAGFRIGHLSERGAQGPPGRVVGQQPPPGARVTPGTEVRLVLDAN